MNGENSGAYRLVIRLRRGAEIAVGRLGGRRFTRGLYLYLGSAKRGLAQRVARHRRLAEEKSGRLHWHIDYLLTHPDSRLVRADLFPGGEECDLSRRAAEEGGEAVTGFGSTDCRSGCPAHLYRISHVPLVGKSRL